MPNIALMQCILDKTLPVILSVFVLERQHWRSGVKLCFWTNLTDWFNDSLVEMNLFHAWMNQCLWMNPFVHVFSRLLECVGAVSQGFWIVWFNGSMFFTHVNSHFATYVIPIIDCKKIWTTYLHFPNADFLCWFGTWFCTAVMKWRQSPAHTEQLILSVCNKQLWKCRN